MVTGFEVLAFVGLLLSSNHADGHFGDAPFVEIHPQRYQREPFLFDADGQLGQFSLVSQQFSLAQRLVGCGVTMPIPGDMTSDKPQLSALDPGEGLLDRNVAVSQAFDLGTGQDDATFEFFENLEAVAGPPIAAD